MRELWRKTVELFWEYPVLWVPFIVTQSCSVVVTFLGSSVRRHIVDSFLVTHSVLGGQATDLDPGRVHNALMFSAPVEAAQHLLEIVLAAIALVWTARCVEMNATGEPISLGFALRQLKLDQHRVLSFAIKFAACLLAGTVLLYALGTPLTLAIHQKLGVNISVMSWVLGWLLVSAAAYIATPWAMTLLKRVGEGSIVRQDVRSSRILAVLATGSTVLLSFAYNSIRHRIQVGSPAEAKMVGAVATLAMNSPLILLFIALALLSLRPSAPLEMSDVDAPDAPPAELT